MATMNTAMNEQLRPLPDFASPSDPKLLVGIILEIFHDWIDAKHGVFGFPGGTSMTIQSSVP
jgi:hypothetical protein